MFIPKPKRRTLLFLAGILLASAGVSQAQIVGTIWENDPNPGDAGFVPSSGPSAQFDTSGINYDSRVSGYTIATFLNNPTFFNQTGGFNAADTADNIHIEFTGSVFLNAGANNFYVNHDDGLTLNITGIGVVVNEPSATAPTTTPFNVTATSAGSYPFVLEYSECCGPPAVLQWQINQQTVGGSVPDVSPTWLLLGLAMTGLALGFRHSPVKLLAPQITRRGRT